MRGSILQTDISSGTSAHRAVVIVVKKMTFPNDKVLTIEMTEKQISGRNISLHIDYEDVLAADSFDQSLLEEE